MAKHNTSSSSAPAVLRARRAKIVNAKQESASTSAKPKATTPTAKAAPVEAEKKAARSGVNIGKTTGMRVMAFQDMTFKRNDEAKYKFTDEEIAKLWREEFPQSRAVLAGRITADMVRAVRRDYNAGRGGHGTPGSTNDSRPYNVVNGKRIQGEYMRARAAKTTEDSKAAKVTTTVAESHPRRVVKPQPAAAKAKPTKGRRTVAA